MDGKDGTGRIPARPPRKRENKTSPVQKKLRVLAAKGSKLEHRTNHGTIMHHPELAASQPPDPRHLAARGHGRLPGGEDLAGHPAGRSAKT